MKQHQQVLESKSYLNKPTAQSTVVCWLDNMLRSKQVLEWITIFVGAECGPDTNQWWAPRSIPQWSMLSNQEHKVYPGSGRGPYVQQWCARGTVLLSTGGACSGAATSKAGEEAWPPSPWWSGWRCCRRIGKQVCGVSCVVCCCLLSFCPLSVPCGGGVRLPFIGQGESELHACRTIQLYGEVWCAVP
jgi:hypothetical protein